MPEHGDLPPQSARAILKLRFSDRAEAPRHGLLDKNRRGELSSGDRAEMESHSRVGNYLALMQAKARLSLKQQS